ncbi:hypothetical protein CWO91_16795 [Bradyrhizobium genosp. SA-3]|uniref:hypothetical protein n=1 Tax=Bradyrhizobium genosp. SA-3 TaxID=508868 RepID=UPI00102A7124|nr:hypothetical protein [Bradyrhizobium genosp. SA-3]RZN09686.1 hypothetical protein CWO91_16795 [Bradyrhizobium genosp. SA-3]
MNYGGSGDPMAAFPKLGFPEEVKFKWERSETYHYYACRPIPTRPELAVAVWAGGTSFWVSLYRLRSSAEALHYHAFTGADELEMMRAEDPLQVQGIIFHLIQNHLPREVTSNAA